MSAGAAFMAVLDGYTLADLLAARGDLAALFRLKAAS
jgi:hypothetical protein